MNRWTPERIERAKAILSRHNRASYQDAMREIGTTSEAIETAFRRAGISAPSRYLRSARGAPCSTGQIDCSQKLRVEIPDLHGSECDEDAVRAFLGDLAALDPDEIVILGDLLDCAGPWTTHARSYASEMRYTYRRDVARARQFLEDVRSRAPRANVVYIEGNHELRIEKTLARIMGSADDAEDALDLLAPAARLKVSELGIRFVRMSEFAGLTRNGSVKIGNVYYTHGAIANKHVASTHLSQFGGNVVFGHVHRAQEVVARTVVGGEIWAACPGTLSKLQPLWQHTNHTEWSHGYGITVEDGARSWHYNIAIRDGASGLRRVLGTNWTSAPRRDAA